MQENLSTDHAIELARRHGRRIAILGTIGALIGLGISYSLPTQWAASSVLQVGQVYTFGGTGVGSTTLIELPARTVERMKLGPFSDAVLSRLSLPTEPGANVETDLIRSSVRVDLLRNADLVQVTVNGRSPDDAKRYAKAFEAQLIQVHADLYKPSVDRLQDELKQVDAAVAAESTRQADLQKLAAERFRIGISEKFSENVLLASTISKSDEELRALRIRRALLSEQLSPLRTFNTRALTDIEVSKKPIFPKKPLFAAAGALMGVTLGLCLGFVLDIKRRKRLER